MDDLEFAPNGLEKDMRKTRVRNSTIVTVALVVASAGIAFAYWTQSGAGTGSATTGTTSDVIVHQTNTVTGLYPDGEAQALSGTLENPNTAAVTVGAISATVTDATEAGGVSGTCDPDWYAITGSGTASVSILPPESNSVTWAGLDVALVNDPAVNQDACKNATITITYTVAAG